MHDGSKNVRWRKWVPLRQRLFRGFLNHCSGIDGREVDIG